MEKLKQRINERGERGALCQDEQDPEQNEHDHHGNQPPQLACPEEFEKVAYDTKFLTGSLEYSH